MARFKRSPRKIESNQGITNTNSTRQVRINPKSKIKPKSLVQFLTGFYKSHPIQSTGESGNISSPTEYSSKSLKYKDKVECTQITQKYSSPKSIHRSPNSKHNEIGTRYEVLLKDSKDMNGQNITKGVTEDIKKVGSSVTNKQLPKSSPSKPKIASKIIDLLNPISNDPEEIQKGLKHDDKEISKKIADHALVDVTHPLDTENSQVPHESNRSPITRHGGHEELLPLSNHKETTLASVRTILLLPNTSLGVPVERNLTFHEGVSSWVPTPHQRSINLSPCLNTKLRSKSSRNQANLQTQAAACLTCLRRSKDCDESIPTCENCLTSNLFCLWPSQVPDIVRKTKSNPKSMEEEKQEVMYDESLSVSA